MTLTITREKVNVLTE